MIVRMCVIHINFLTRKYQLHIFLYHAKIQYVENFQIIGAVIKGRANIMPNMFLIVLQKDLLQVNSSCLYRMPTSDWKKKYNLGVITLIVLLIHQCYLVIQGLEVYLALVLEGRHSYNRWDTNNSVTA